MKNSLNEVSTYLKRTLIRAGYDQQHMQVPDDEETGRLISLVIKEIMKGEAGHPPLLSDKNDQNTQLKKLFR
ncbi:hypothetical protein [Pedobacter alluvionis]|uniref:Uncharacterized protein n=1 Tax=Pedobacter alluvionis TaxID=475253 RepID=A0ABY2HK96_9SPHI|nr:hypothetical protein [Pedobacter alluvionis]TFB28368.1 hypothetical protein E3V97_23075 [Pedobacter alluvionis]